ncbi:putative UDP-glucoronosyl and UDP-glucosyl transferase [Colletotrichum lupini]|nr:putative UDP-glucoronosyl and UDP-glucosyl transferase [Colletotrichum lupini]
MNFFFYDRNYIHSHRRILLCSTVGGFIHAAPVLELGAVLAARGHEVHFGTNSGQEHWASDYPSITRVHSFGPAMPDADAEAHYAHMIQWRPSDGPDTWFHLRELMLDTEIKPDMIIADFFLEAAAKDMMIEFGVPIAMPYLLAPVSCIPGQPGFQVDFTPTSEKASVWSRIRNEMTRWTRTMRRRQGVKHSVPVAPKPNHLVFVNFFFGLEPAKDLPPLMQVVGPILGDEYPQLDESYRAFLESHNKTVYVAPGTHIAVLEADLMKLLNGLVMAIDVGHINGAIWSIGKSARSAHVERTDGRRISFGEILDEKHPDIRITSLSHSRRQFSANETLFHGKPTLFLGFFFDQLANSARLVEADVGLALDEFDFTATEISDKIGRIVSDVGGSFGRNVERMKRIARVASRRKELAVDIVEEVIFDHELRLVGGRALRPMHLQTADMRMSVRKARNWDLWLVSVSMLAVGGTIYFMAAKYARRLDLGIFRFVSGIVYDVN